LDIQLWPIIRKIAKAFIQQNKINTENMLIYIISFLLILILVYLFILRPLHLKWGARTEEVKMMLPGDELVQKPDFNATLGITIKATPEDTWKWIVQIGSGRAGWYSIDWMDNGGKKSTDKILPEFQEIFEGQFIPFTPDQKNGMWVKLFRNEDYILWVDKKGMATWTWKLLPDGEGSTRLITRLRTKYNWRSLWIIYYLIYDMGDIVMMRKCMKGIKK
jgi:preprotein translocase subunit YajC